MDNPEYFVEEVSINVALGEYVYFSIFLLFQFPTAMWYKVYFLEGNGYSHLTEHKI